MSGATGVPSMRWGDSDSSSDEDDIKVSSLLAKQPPPEHTQEDDSMEDFTSSTAPSSSLQKRQEQGSHNNQDSLQALSSRKLVSNNPFLANKFHQRQMGNGTDTTVSPASTQQRQPAARNRNFRGNMQQQQQQQRQPQDWKAMAKSASKFGQNSESTSSDSGNNAANGTQNAVLDGSNWMANRRAKQQQAEAAQRQQEEERKRQQQEDARSKRKGQMEALKAAMTKIQSKSEEGEEKAAALAVTSEHPTEGDDETTKPQPPNGDPTAPKAEQASTKEVPVADQAANAKDGTDQTNSGDTGTSCGMLAPRKVEETEAQPKRKEIKEEIPPGCETTKTSNGNTNKSSSSSNNGNTPKSPKKKQPPNKNNRSPNRKNGGQQQNNNKESKHNNNNKKGGKNHPSKSLKSSGVVEKQAPEPTPTDESGTRRPAAAPQAPPESAAPKLSSLQLAAIRGRATAPEPAQTQPIQPVEPPPKTNNNNNSANFSVNSYTSGNKGAKKKRNRGRRGGRGSSNRSRQGGRSVSRFVDASGDDASVDISILSFHSNYSQSNYSQGGYGGKSAGDIGGRLGDGEFSIDLQSMQSYHSHNSHGRAGRGGRGRGRERGRRRRHNNTNNHNSSRSNNVKGNRDDLSLGSYHSRQSYQSGTGRGGRGRGRGGGGGRGKNGGGRNGGSGGRGRGRGRRINSGGGRGGGGADDYSVGHQSYHSFDAHPRGAGGRGRGIGRDFTARGNHNKHQNSSKGVKKIEYHITIGGEQSNSSEMVPNGSVRLSKNNANSSNSKKSSHINTKLEIK